MIEIVKVRGRRADAHGRIWTATVLSESEAEQADFRFWYDGLTPEERVAAVRECLASALAREESVRSHDYEEFIESLN